jgi:hypothetical protein
MVKDIYFTNILDFGNQTLKSSKSFFTNKILHSSSSAMHRIVIFKLHTISMKRQSIYMTRDTKSMTLDTNSMKRHSISMTRDANSMTRDIISMKWNPLKSMKRN